jgi:hypothetical protein
MRVYRKLVGDLLVGDYLGVVSNTSGGDRRPECYRRVEKIEYIEASAGTFFANGYYQLSRDVSPHMGPVIVWCHGVAAALIYPPGDVSVWEDVPEERREWEAGDPWWGMLISDSLFAVSRTPTEEEVKMAQMGDQRNRPEA